MTKTHQIKLLRRDVARIQSIMAEKQAQETQEGAK